ncbi:hypothetical protein MGG_15520 [Pyricularia oryzae 70-15]|uniref:Uncharacterized protein n=1 Tax=Pyricularia oryzae (strain 70-15 / ATCC MYA-4617 / FGSC 8958) TaxID=242507 RepID=G4MYE6_PYRO7|nr:uncharacterized protein MGG_15520 [Pyricularia oryzae 70-15]EHA53566.1 hypothetical protein MGG_15520 [Pyricularia oryzae 70-15]
MLISRLLALLATVSLAAAQDAPYTGPCSETNCGADGQDCSKRGYLCVPYPHMDLELRKGCTCSAANLGQVPGGVHEMNLSVALETTFLTETLTDGATSKSPTWLHNFVVGTDQWSRAAARLGVLGRNRCPSGGSHVRNIMKQHGAEDAVLYPRTNPLKVPCMTCRTHQSSSNEARPETAVWPSQITTPLSNVIRKLALKALTSAMVPSLTHHKPMTVSFVFLLVILQDEWQGNIMFGIDILGDNCRCRPPPNANQHTTSISGAQYSTTQPSTPPHPTPAPIIDPRQLKKRHSTGSEACGYRTDAQCKTCSNVPPLQLTPHRKVRPFACGSGLTCTNSKNLRRTQATRRTRVEKECIGWPIDPHSTPETGSGCAHRAANGTGCDAQPAARSLQATKVSASVRAVRAWGLCCGISGDFDGGEKEETGLSGGY